MVIYRPWHNENLSQSNSFAQYKHWIDFYSKKNGINLIIDETLPAPAAVPDNSQQDIPTILVNPTLLKGKINLDDEGVLQVLFHEIEHLKEDTALKSTSSGRAIAWQRQERFKQHGVFAKTYHELENIIRDIYVNNQVVDAKNTPVLDNALRKNYAEHFAKDSDFLNFPIHDAHDHTKIVWHKALPKHTQFGYAMLREAMLPNEQCNVAPDVRKAINRVKKSGVLQKASTWLLEHRLQNIWKFIEPIYTKFLEEDIENQEKDNNQSSDNSQQDGKWDSQENTNSSSHNSPQEWDKSQQNNNEKQPGDKKSESKDSSPTNAEENTPSNESTPSEPTSSSNKQWPKKKKKSLIEQAKEKIRKLLSGEEWEKQDNTNDSATKDNDSSKPRNPFEDIYDQMSSSPHLLEDSLTAEDYEKLKDAIKTKVEQDSQPPKSPKQLEIEQRAKKVREKDKTQSLEDLTQQITEYDRFYSQLEQVRNPHTWNTVMEDIEQLFRYIRSHRLKPQIKPHWPVDIDHSIGKLHNPSIASWLAQLLGGDIQAPLWEENEKKERSKNHVGRFDISIIADGSWSMKWEKNRQQKINVLLIFEAFKRLHDMLDTEKRDLAEPLEFHTDGYIFKDAANWVNHIKDMSDDFTDEQRLKTYKELDYYKGNDTNMHEALAHVYEGFTNTTMEYKQDIRDKKCKRIIFILSDGEPCFPWGWDASEATKTEITNLRQEGILVYGIWITSKASAIKPLFWDNESELWFWKVCDNPEELAWVILDLLSPHLKQ